MAATAWVIWLCACVRYWPYHGDGTCVSVLISVDKSLTVLKPVYPKKDQQIVSPYNLIAWLNIKVVRMEEMIIGDKIDFFKRILPTNKENVYVDLGA